MLSILAGPFSEWVVQVLTYIVMLTCPRTTEYLGCVWTVSSSSKPPSDNTK